MAATNNTSYKWVDNSVGVYRHYIYYQFMSSWPGGASGTQAAAVTRGAGAWNAQGRELYFAKTTAGSSVARIDISYEDLAWPNTSALAVMMVETFSWDVKMMEANIAFNSQPDGYPAHTLWYWGTSTTVPSGKFDAQSVAAHEFGHCVSLNHSGASADTMYASIPIQNSSKRTLTTHDADGIKVMYPPK